MPGAKTADNGTGSDAMRTAYRSVSDLPAEIPVFPLAGAILLPRATMPLNIFEPRYLAMVDAALRGDRVIGIIQPAGEGGATGSPQAPDAPLNRVGCAGRITGYQEIEDGRLLIVLTGLARFAPSIDRSQNAPYRTFRADYLEFANDLVAGAGEEEVDRDGLLKVLRKFLEGRQATVDWKQISSTGTEQLVNWLAIVSPFGSKEKQALLEAPTLKARAETLVTLAEMELASSGGGGGSRVQ